MKPTWLKAEYRCSVCKRPVTSFGGQWRHTGGKTHCNRAFPEKIEKPRSTVTSKPNEAIADK